MSVCAWLHAHPDNPYVSGCRDGNFNFPDHYAHLTPEEGVCILCVRVCSHIHMQAHSIQPHTPKFRKPRSKQRPPWTVFVFVFVSVCVCVSGLNLASTTLGRKRVAKLRRALDPAWEVRGMLQDTCHENTWHKWPSPAFMKIPSWTCLGGAVGLALPIHADTHAHKRPYMLWAAEGTCICLYSFSSLAGTVYVSVYQTHWCTVPLIAINPMGTTQENHACTW